MQQDFVHNYIIIYKIIYTLVRKNRKALSMPFSISSSLRTKSAN